jgi:hypothetical protein
MPSQPLRLCLECGEPFKGRIDKKFCSDICRIAFNNRLNSEEISYIRNINNILRKNRRILMTMNPTGKDKVSYGKLKSRGFDFNYFTSIYKTKDGALYYYCYDYGYLAIDKEWYLLVVRKEFQNA